MVGIKNRKRFPAQEFEWEPKKEKLPVLQQLSVKQAANWLCSKAVKTVRYLKFQLHYSLDGAWVLQTSSIDAIQQYTAVYFDFIMQMRNTLRTIRDTRQPRPRRIHVQHNVQELILSAYGRQRSYDIFALSIVHKSICMKRNHLKFQVFPKRGSRQFVVTDIKGPQLKTCDGKKSVGVIVSRCFKLKKAIPIANRTVAEIATIFSDHWIMSYETLSHSLIENERQFFGKTFTKLCFFSGWKW